jgi:hypothetical protein
VPTTVELRHSVGATTGQFRGEDNNILLLRAGARHHRGTPRGLQPQTQRGTVSRQMASNVRFFIQLGIDLFVDETQ